MKPTPTDEAEALRKCRVCKGKCRIEIIQPNENMPYASQIWICENNRRLGGKCSDEHAYLSAAAWNTRASSPPSERAEIVGWLRRQSGKGADLGIASDKGSTRRAAYGGGSLALSRAADEIERGAHIIDGIAEALARGETESQCGPPSDSGDIVERLRAGYHPISESGEFADDTTLSEAAAHILALREALAEMEAAGTKVLSAIDSYNEKHGKHLVSPAFFPLGRALARARSLLPDVQGEG